MNELPTVQVHGKKADGLTPVFEHVFSILGQDPQEYADRIASNVQRFRKANAGLTEQELIDLAKNDVPKMVAAAMRQSTGYERANQEDAAKANAVRMAAAQDRYNNRYVAPIAGTFSENPVQAREQFLSQSDKFADAAQKNFEANKVAREADLMNQAKALTNRQEQFKTNLAGQETLAKTNLNDPGSSDSAAARAEASARLKEIGRPDLIPNLENMSANQIAGFMNGPAMKNLEARKQLAEIEQSRAQTGQTRAQTGLVNAQTRGAQAEAGLRELTTKAANDAYNQTGNVPAAVQDQVYGAPDIARQKQAQDTLDRLNTSAPERQKSLGAIARVREQLKTTSTNPAAGFYGSLLPDTQKIIKDLAELEAQTGKNVGATDLARRMGSASSADIAKYPSVIRSILAKLEAEIQKDEIINQQLAKASRSGGLMKYNEPYERAKLKTVSVTNADGNVITKTFQLNDPDMREFVNSAKKRKLEVQVF